MANRYPLVANASTLTIQELPSNDTLLVDNLTSTGNLSVAGNSNLGLVSTVFITGGTNGQYLTTDGNGNLSFTTLTVSTDSISNGNSNVAVASSNGNVGISVAGNANVVNVTGSNVFVTANIIPTANITYDLGTSSNRFKDLWLSNSTIYIGNASITTDGGNLVLTNPDGGQSVVSGNQTVSSNTLVEANSNIVVANTYIGLSANGTANVLLLSNLGANVNGYANISGNANVGNLGAVGNVTAAYFIGNGSLLTGIDATAIQNGTANVRTYNNGNVTVSAAGAGNIVVVTSTGANINGYANISGNANVGNIGATGVVATTLSGSLTTAAQPNITSVGSLTSLSVTGNITSGNVSGTLVTGTLTTGAQPNITSLGTLTSALSSGNITAEGNLISDNVIARTGLLTLSASGSNQDVDIKPTGTGVVDVWGARVSNVGTPTQSTDVATKQYVDDVAQGLHTHDSCNAATTGTLATISGGTVTYDNGTSGVGATLTTTGSYTTIDGVTLSNGMRILVKDEANAAHNGIYDRTSSTVLTRSDDFNTPTEMAGGDFTFVSAGTLYDNTGWVMPDPVTTVGTSNVVWIQFSGAGTYTAGTGLTLVGSQFNLSNTTVTAASYGNGDYVATFTVNAQGQLTAAANTVITANAANLTGSTLASSIITSSLTTVGTLGSLSVTGNIGAGNVNATTFAGNLSGNVTGTILTAAQTSITSLGTLTSLGVSGTITAANITANTGSFTGNGAGLTTLNGSNISSGTIDQARLANSTLTLGNTTLTLGGTTTTVTGLTGVTATTFTGNVTGNVSGSAGSATTAGTVTTAAQPNITSVGTLTGLTVKNAGITASIHSNNDSAATLEVCGDTSAGAQQVNATVYVGQSRIFGGGIKYNSSPDTVTLFRRDNNVDTNFMTVTYNSSDVTFAAGVTATTLTETSSMALKENFRPIENPLDTVLKLVGHIYDRKDGTLKGEAGLVAEEVAEILPNLVGLDKDGNPDSVKYSRLTVYLLESIKVLKDEIDSLKGTKRKSKK